MMNYRRYKIIVFLVYLCFGVVTLNDLNIIYNMSKGKVLTLQLVFNKTKCDNLQSIKNLNLWGNELQDLQLIEKMPNLEVISLSVNKISTLRDFSTCNKLQELYLRKNCITDLREIRYLTKLPSLKVLWLHDNPCATANNYREIVIHHLPNLTKLDNNIITNEERNDAQKVQFELFTESESNIYSQTPSMLEKQSRISEDKRSRPFSEVPQPLRQVRQSREQRQEKINVPQSSQWRGSNKQIRNHSYESVASEQVLNRNKNILIAVMSLVKELDLGSLQLVHKEIEKIMISKHK